MRNYFWLGLPLANVHLPELVLSTWLNSAFASIVFETRLLSAPLLKVTNLWWFNWKTHQLAKSYSVLTSLGNMQRNPVAFSFWSRSRSADTTRPRQAIWRFEGQEAKRSEPTRDEHDDRQATDAIGGYTPMLRLTCWVLGCLFLMWGKFVPKVHGGQFSRAHRNPWSCLCMCVC